jgi:UDP-3-O-[3-hydroxymyristoyl] glucosamine N-acyltransferase
VSERSYPLSQLAEMLQGRAQGEDVTITGVGSLDQAGSGQIAFVEKVELLPLAETSGASALIVPPNATVGHKPMIVTEDPRLAFSRVLEIFAPKPRCYEGIHPTAVVEAGVVLGSNVSIGAHAFVGENTILGDDVIIHPLAYVGYEVVIGNATAVHPQVYIGERVIIGARCIIHAGAAVGADGFGFAPTPEGHRKIHQIGTVIIEDDVEVGAHTTIDRATINATRIGQGTKMDDGVHVAHNVTIGRNCLLCGQVGIAGSTAIGDNVVMGGQAGINDHIKICDNVTLGGGCGVISDITEPGIYSGFPATKHSSAMRAEASVRRLPDLLREIRDLRRRIRELEELLDKDG